MIDHDEAPPQCIAVKKGFAPFPIAACSGCCARIKKFRCGNSCLPCMRHERKDGRDVVFAERTTFEEF